MTINHAAIFGNKNTVATAKAQLWLNIGYQSDVVDEQSNESRFVSLPLGIPVDTQEPLPTNSRNEDYSAFQSARNDLLAKIMAAGSDLKPGESRIVNLTVQLRRVASDVAPAATGNNPYTCKIML